ncbi:hypothetical protein ACFC0D_03585 [Streptomyces sp. NPDC056222]|uniref:hypothetical protein n=1 Tax=Streptomyces sp. NPDC056222 TaxID=3345749 RepID=UPI0035D9A93A
MIVEYEEMLAGLDEVDWAGLNHAYGSAEDVPGRIRAVCGDDEPAREDAFLGLFNHLAHQGTRCQASPFAVPFLARIALAGPAPARERVLELLTRLAVSWDDELEILDGADVAVWRAEAADHTPEKLLPWYDEQLAVEHDAERRRNLAGMREWMAAGNPVDARDAQMRSYDAVLAELPGLLGLLDDVDPRIRTRAAYLLAWFPEAADTTLPLLLALAAREPAPVATATALVAAGIVGTPALSEEFASYLGAEDSLVRWAAAVAIAHLAGRTGATPGAARLDGAVAELARAASTPAPVPATDFGQGDFHGYTAKTLLALPAPVPSSVVVACLPRIEPHNRTYVARTVLPEVFPVPLPEPLPPYADLSGPQQQLLRTVADLEEGHWNTAGIGVRLAPHGLPDTHNALRAYVGLPPLPARCGCDHART